VADGTGAFSGRIVINSGGDGGNGRY
jgi:hypothetical protein